MSITIKRYPNRKLYSTESKQYITLEEIATLIRNDVDVSVIDAETGDNITAYIMAQVIMGEEKRKAGSISLRLFTALIRGHEDSLDLRVHNLQNTVDGLIYRKIRELPTRGDILKLNKQVEELSGLLDILLERKTQ
jgi:polyhydroxyalkanoate synthesis repressor PhaR